MSDDTTSVTAALFGLAGFEVLAAADAGGALRMSTQGALDHYRHKIGEHEQALTDLHEAERFRTVVDDHTDEIEADRGP